MSCACGSNAAFKNCCEPFLKGEKFPETAEALMRSRYTAFTLADMKYIQKTLAPEAQTDFDVEENRKWAEQAKWRKLAIISTDKGTATDTEGVVEFCAFYGHEDQELQHHEVAQFRKDKSGHWLFIDGDAHMHPADEDVETAHAKPETFVRTEEKIGRNDPCQCGSGKKFKKCCGK